MGERKRVGFGSEWKGVEKARELGLCLDRAGEIQTQGAQPLASHKAKYLFYTPFLVLLVSKIKFWSNSFAFWNLLPKHYEVYITSRLIFGVHLTQLVFI